MRRTARISKESGLSDLLNFAHLIDDGVIVNKDGAFLTSYQFFGPDLQSAGSAEMDALTGSINRMLNQLEDGWLIHVDEIRIPSLNYPKETHFQDAVSRLIDEERRQQYEREGAHFENVQFLTFVWKFPIEVVKTTQHWFVEGLDKEAGQKNLTVLLKEFNEQIARLVGLLSIQLRLEKLSSHDLLSFLNTCITGELLPVATPPQELFIDVVLARKPVVGGYYPKIGDKHLRILSLIGYVHPETLPGMLDAISTYPLVYRFSNRFIALSESTAEKEIKRYQRNWNNKVKGFWGIVKEAAFGQTAQKLNQDALLMSEETNEALTMNSQRTARFGYWTGSIILLHESPDILDKAATALTRYIEQAGFALIREDINALDAWLGSIPGHGSRNFRRNFITGLNLAHCLPLHTLWPGRLNAHPSSLLPKDAPPVFYARTTGLTPFRFHLDVTDVGHQVVLGPTGAGKSTYLGFLIAQFLRYQDAQVFVFDKDFSHQALTYALSGHHYHIGGEAELSFCPLAQLEKDSDKTRAAQWVEDLVVLQNVTLTPAIRTAIYQAIVTLGHDSRQSRNLTILQSVVQDEEVRAALQYYTVNGQVKLLDATHDSLQQGFLQTFEMNWLLAQKPEVYLPVLRYLFDQIDTRLDGKNTPTLIILEEAWAYIAHEVFAKKLKDWLKTLRKKNARVIFATQSLADLYDPVTQSLTGTTAAILESCPTRIYLPNQNIDAEIKTLYHKMGLSQRELELISQIAIPKKHYFVMTPEGRRLIELGLDDGSIARAFIGLSREQSQALIACQKLHGAQWLSHWLREQGLADAVGFGAKPERDLCIR